MVKRRKPRGSQINEIALGDWKESVGDEELVRLSFRLETLEGLRKAGTLNTRFIALEALGALAGARHAGRTDEILKSCWPAEWGTETMTVPLSLLLALRDGWLDYMAAPPGKSLGEALKIEGGGQGRKPMKARLKAVDQTKELARAVEARYLQIEGAPDSMTLDDVFFEVAAHDVSFQTVKDAHRAYGQAIRKELRSLGLLSG